MPRDAFLGRASSLFVACSSALVIAACSADDETATVSPADTGGAGAAGAATGGALATGANGGSAGSPNGGVGNAGAGGAPSSGATPLLDACVAYMRAQCHRRVECKELLSDCSDSYVQMCPDFGFSPGSTRTAANMLACATDWSTFSCDQLLLGYAPACALPGTRAPGEACVYGSQCTSGYCDAEQDACGVCVGTLTAGAACNTSDRTHACPDGYGCESNGTGTVCTARTPTPVKIDQPGDPCTAGSGCSGALECFLDASGTNHCGDIPTAGQQCARTFSDEQPYLCSNGLACSAGVCEPGPVAGEPCAAGQRCGIDAKCDSSAGGLGTCIPKSAPGEQCTIPLDCLSGSTCACVSGTACASHVCMTKLAEGAACGQPNATCPPNTQCTGGVCTRSDALTTFAELCPGK